MKFQPFSILFSFVVLFGAAVYLYPALLQAPYFVAATLRQQSHFEVFPS